MATGRVVAAVRDSGAFQVGSTSMSLQEVRSTIEVARKVFCVSEEMKRDILAKWFRRRDVVEEEFYWYHPVSPEMDRVLLSAFPDPQSYQMFRYLFFSLVTFSGHVQSCSSYTYYYVFVE